MRLSIRVLIRASIVDFELSLSCLNSYEETTSGLTVFMIHLIHMIPNVASVKLCESKKMS